MYFGTKLTGRQVGRQAVDNRQAGRQVQGSKNSNAKILYGKTGTKHLGTWQLRQTDNGTKEMVQYTCTWSEADDGSGDRWAGKVR